MLIARRPNGSFTIRRLRRCWSPFIAKRPVVNAPLGRPLRPADREEPGVKSLGVGQNLLVVFRAEQEDDLLAAVFNRRNRTMQACAAGGNCPTRSRENSPKSTREIGRASTRGARLHEGEVENSDRLTEAMETRAADKCLPISPIAARPVRGDCQQR